MVSNNDNDTQGQHDLFSSGDQDAFPTTTVHQHRLQIFEPTRRPKLAQRTISTLWGTATINGKLGQGHADVLESISARAEEWRLNAEGTVTVLIDPFKLRTTASGGKVGSGSQINKLLLEIQQTVVTVVVHAHGVNVRGSLITLVDLSPRTKQPSRGGFSGFDAGGEIKRGGRSMWRITLGRPLVELLRRDLRLDYDPEPIAALRYGISQAIARHVATHRHDPRGGWKLETLLKAVGAETEGASVKHRRNELLEDAVGLKRLGVSISQENSAKDRRRTVYRIKREPCPEK